MDEIRAAAIEGLQKLARGGLEVGGVLFGSRREAGIRILTWRPIFCEYALGPTLQLSMRDRGELTRLLDASPGDPDLRGLEPVGWFLSHTRSEILLSPTDVEIFNFFFPEPWQVTLVLHPTQAGPASAGFFVRETDGTLKTGSSYQEFVIKPLHRTARTAETPSTAAKDRLVAPPPPQIPAAATRVRPAKAVQSPLFRTLERPASRRPWLAIVPVLLGLIVAGVLVKEKYLPVTNQPFAFHVNDSGETLQVEWNQNAPSIRNAHVGVIDINDGGETKRYSLNDDELHSGKMTYLPHSRDLELRMTVYPMGSTASQEFVRFLDPGPVAPPVPLAEVEQVRKERDQLEVEVNQLKEELRKERTTRRRR